MAIIGGIIAAAGAIGGAAISAKGSQKSADAQVAARQKAIDDANAARERIFGEVASGRFSGGYGLEDTFGSKVDPSAALFHPVDVTGSQADAIGGNIQNFDLAAILSNRTNEFVDDQALQRLNRLFPGASENIDQIGENTSALLRGELPPDVLSQITRDTQSVGGQLGTPGTTSANTLRHLGLNRLDAVNQGTSMFTSFVDLANRSISPVGNQLRPQDQFLAPSERLRADILQAELEQQGRLSAAVLAAQPDPAAASLFNSELQAQLVNAGLQGGINSGINTGIGAQTLGAGVQQGGALAADYFSRGSGGGSGGGGNTYNYYGQAAPRAQPV